MQLTFNLFVPFVHILLCHNKHTTHTKVPTTNLRIIRMCNIKISALIKFLLFGTSACTSYIFQKHSTAVLNYYHFFYSIKLLWNVCVCLEYIFLISMFVAHKTLLIFISYHDAVEIFFGLFMFFRI